MPRRALVLSGGGAKGSFQLGVVQELIFTRGLDFEILCGTSVGALNASILAQAPFLPENPQISLENLRFAFYDLKKIWLEEIQGNSSVYTERAFGKIGAGMGKDSLYDPGPLEGLLEQFLDPAKLRASKRKLSVQYVSLETGLLKSADQTDPDILKLVLASSTMPFFFPPVDHQGEHLVDGGIRDITPLSQAFDAGAEVIYVIYATPFDVERQKLEDNWMGTKVGAFDFLARSVGLMINEIYRTDTNGAKRLNVIKKSWVSIRSQLPKDHPSALEIDRELESIRFAPIIEIKPERHIIRDSLDFSPEAIRENYEYGREVAGVTA